MLMRSSLKLLSTMLIMLFLAACTGKMSYRFVDWAVAWSVDDYVEWNREQQADFDRRLKQRIHWHQSTQLPRYADLIEQLQAELDQPVSETTLQGHAQTLMVLYNDVLHHISPDAASLLSQLNDEQVSALVANLDKKIHKDQQKYTKASIETLRKERIARVEKQLKRWTGSSTKEQRQRIQQWEQQLHSIWPEWLDSRRQWRDAMATTLEDRSSESFEREVRALFNGSLTEWPEEYTRKSSENSATTFRLLVDLHAGLSDKQRRHLDKELSYWAKAFIELASEAEQSTEQLHAGSDSASQSG